MTPGTRHAPLPSSRSRRVGRATPRRPAIGRVRTRRYRRPDGTFRVPHLDDVYAGMAAARLQPVLDQPAALRSLVAACAARRSDGRRTHEAVSFALASSMDHETGAITATHDQLGERAARRAGRGKPYSHDTVARVVTVLVDAGVLVLPPGLGGKSAIALRSQLNQAPTYFVVAPVVVPAGHDVDPDDEAAVAAAAARIAERLDLELTRHDRAADQCVDVVAYPSRSRREQGVQVVGGNSFYEGQDRRRSRFDPHLVPATAVERRQAGDWLRSALKIGVVPPWRIDAMLARYWRAGLTVAAVKRMACERPDGTGHGPLPLGGDRDDAVRRSPKSGATVVDVLLGCLGYRLNLWRTAPPAAGPRVVRPAEPDTGPSLVGEAREAAAARVHAVLAQVRARRAQATHM